MTTDTKTTNESDVSAIRRLALSYVPQIAADAEIKAHVNEVVKAKEVSRRSPVNIMLDMLRVFGNETLALFPLPGSEKVPGQNTPFDKYSDTASDGTKIEGSFYNDLADNTPWGKDWHAANTLVKKALNNDGTVPDPYKTMGKDRLKGEQNKLTTRISNNRLAFRQGMALYYRLGRIQAECTVDVGYVTDGEGDNEKIADINQPIQLFDRNKRGNSRVFSALEVLRLDVDKAKLMDGGPTWKNLLATLSRGKKGAGKGATVAVLPVTTKETFEDHASSFAHFFTDTKNPFSVILDMLKDKDSDDLVMSLGRIIDGLDGVDKHLRSRYDRLMSEQVAKDTSERNAKATKAGDQAAA